MRRKLDCTEIIPWLSKTAEDFSRDFLDDMPPVEFVCGKPEECKGVEARYHATARVIEFSPGFIASCWKGKRRFWDLGRLQRTLRHELIHAWVDWKGCWSSYAGAHNEWFLYKAWKVRLNINATRAHLPEIIPLDDDIRLGWEPEVMPVADWRGLVAAAKGWEGKEWGELVSGCQLLAASRRALGADDWRRTLASLEQCNPSVAGYESILKLDEWLSSYGWRESTQIMGLRSESCRGVLEDLKRRPAAEWPEIIDRWHEVARSVEHWERESIYQIAEEFGRIRPKLYAMAEAIRLSTALREFFGRVWARFDHEVASTETFVGGVGSECYCEEQYALYCELNHLFFQKPDTDIYQFFRLIRAAPQEV